MTVNAHEQFHRNAAKSARQKARELYSAAGFDRTTDTYRKAEALDKLAGLHDFAAQGTMTFTDCPRCHETKE